MQHTERLGILQFALRSGIRRSTKEFEGIHVPSECGAPRRRGPEAVPRRDSALRPGGGLDTDCFLAEGSALASPEGLSSRLAPRTSHLGTHLAPPEGLPVPRLSNRRGLGYGLLS